MTKAEATRRSVLRRALRQAAAGDRLSYLRLANESLDLATEAFAAAGVVGSPELLSASLGLFSRLWGEVGAMRRVSDWERTLCLSLGTIQPTLAFTQPDPVARRLLPLAALSRFSLVALEMEGWSLAQLSLGQRLSTEYLARHLGKARSELGGFDLATLDPSLQPAFDFLNRSLCPGASNSFKHRADRLVAKHGALRDFKARWLETRCELIEFRQRVRLSGGDRHPFGKNLEEAIADTLPNRPGLGLRLRLWTRFDPAV